MERKRSKECPDSFLWTNKSLSLSNCVLRNSTLFASWRIRVLGLFWTSQCSEVSEETSRHSVLYGQGKYLFKGFMQVFYILTLVWKKNHKMCLWNSFFAMCWANLTYVNGSRIQLVLYENCFLGLTYGFLNKNFQEIKLFICPCSLVTLAQNTITRLQIVRFLQTLQTGYSQFLN